MKKLILLTIGIILLLGSCTSSKEDGVKGYGWDDLGLVGKVKAIKETSFEAIDVFGNIEKGNIIEDDSENINNTLLIFNLQGNLLESNYYNTDGSLSNKSIIKFNEEGKFAGTNGYNTEGSPVFKSNMVYNDSGNPIENSQYQFNSSYPDGILMDRRVFKYNNNNKVSEEQVFKKKELSYKVIYKYDDKGNKIVSSVYFPDGNIYNKDVFKYDDKGNMTEVKSYNSNDILESKSVFIYNDDGNKEEDIKYNSDNNIIYKWTCRYNEIGNKVEENVYSSTYNQNTTKKYDEKENLIEESKFDGDGRLENKTTNHYEYDTKGNWIKKVVYKNIKPQFIIEREIEYF